MRLPMLAIAALAAVAVSAAEQQPAGAFKGKVKPGLYENRVELDMGTKDGKKVSTAQRCLTDADIDKLALESNASCKTTDFKIAGDTATFRVTCKGVQEMVSDVEIAYNAKGYVTSSTGTMKAAGSAPVKMSQLVVSRYLGACPDKPKK